MGQISKVMEFTCCTQDSARAICQSEKDSAFYDIMSASMAPKGRSIEQNPRVTENEKTEIKDFVNQQKEKTPIKQNVKSAQVVDKISVPMTKEGLEASLKTKISKSLGVSEKELEKLLAESGLTVWDLLEPATLKQFVMDVVGIVDPAQLLTDEDLLNQLTSIMDEVATFKEDHGEIIQSILQNAEEFQSALENAVVVNSEEAVSEVEEEEIKVSKDTEVEKQEPTLTVEKDETYVERSADKNQNSSKEDSGETEHELFQQFVDNLTNAVSDTDSTEYTGLGKVQQMQDIVNQVVERIKITLSEKSTSMEMQLNPHNLGKVHVSIITRAGQMTAHFAVESEMAREALESQLSSLRDNLSEQGLQVDAIEVTIAEQGLDQHDFSGQQQKNAKNTTKKAFSNRGFSDDEEESEEEVVNNQILGTGTVDFSA